jgi:uncharacterized protein YbaP (TraB family)
MMTAMWCNAQQKKPNKYPSLLWEITGNGLQKPSYLFGTMHVSNKMAFHLSDSFYNAIIHSDAVALELNPELWQRQMILLDQLKHNYSNFTETPTGDYLNENSFRIGLYDKELKTALSSEPTIVNSLLYRSFKAKEDFEEDTFLDLYIFQTGKRLGKRATGVENYVETEKLVLEAYADMANEKKKKNIDAEDDSEAEMAEKLKDAYKQGDLDLLDSLDIAMEKSIAFREKFLYRRNEIQAASIDTIIKKSSLFAGVGAAHLPGKRGVIELLRKQGYQLRPIMMTSKDAGKREDIDKLKVPVTFVTSSADDDFYKVDAPGPLYKMADDLQQLNRQQFADMANGSYYQVTRVKTYTALLNQQATSIKLIIDSLLYENIPGKIIKKTAISRNGYSGYDIVNKTRRGDLQRFHIFITPSEVLIFKVSGKENYAIGKEGNNFFASISMQPIVNKCQLFTPDQGGFSMVLPHLPTVYCNPYNSDGIKRWEYQAKDSATGNTYLILKKSVHNMKFLEEDSFDVKLMEQSVRSPLFFERQLNRSFGTWQGYPCLLVKEKMKDSSFVNARYIINGPAFFALIVKSKQDNIEADSFFNSFQLKEYNYPASKLYEDTFFHFSVTTSASPIIDNSYRATVEKVTADISQSNKNKSYWPKNKNAAFTCDATGERIGVSIQQYPMYYYVHDSASFWKKEMEDRYDENDLILYKKEPIINGKNVIGYTFELRDSGSSRAIKRMLLLHNDLMYSLFTICDTFKNKHPFTDSFFASFTPEKKSGGRPIFTNCLDSFFAHLFSEDSNTKATARQFISNIYYGEKGVAGIIKAINQLNPSDKNYTETKTKLIAELGFIKDSSMPVVVKHLQNIYQQTADTSMFQNEIMEALARHKTKASFDLFKELILQDPPVFDNSYSYISLVELLKDSLKLAASLYPELLQLTTLDDYKEPVNALLVSLVDSGYIKGNDYKEYFNKLYFDAKILLKKQQGKEDKKIAEDKKNEEEEPFVPIGGASYKDELKGYSILLAPFYFTNKSISLFFKKLLQSSNNDVVLNTAMVLLKNGIAVADSLIYKLAANNEWRCSLYTQLEKIKQGDKFPAAFKTQQQIAESFLAAKSATNNIDSIIFVDKIVATVAGKKGLVYFFKYKIKKEDAFKMGISGPQPEDGISISSGNLLTSLTNKKITTRNQFEEQLNKQLFNLHKSAKRYFQDESSEYKVINYK